MGLSELMRSLGERFHEGENVKRIRKHANQYVVPSNTTEALFIVHPYFNRLEGGLGDKELSRELEEAKSLLLNVVKTRKTRQATKNLRRMVFYAEDGNKFPRYKDRLERVISGLTGSRTGVILVESMPDYWVNSSHLVESGKVNQVIITYDRSGTVVNTERESLPDLVRGIRRGFIAGSYGSQCPLAFARSLVALGIEVTPVSDLLFDNYLTPETVMTQWRQQKIPFTFSVTSGQLRQR